VVTDGNGCTASNSVDVLVNPKPQVTITPLNPVICQGAKVNLTAITSGGTLVIVIYGVHLPDFHAQLAKIQMLHRQLIKFIKSL
jgi:hypothetical protein